MVKRLYLFFHSFLCFWINWTAPFLSFTFYKFFGYFPIRRRIRKHWFNARMLKSNVAFGDFLILFDCSHICPYQTSFLFFQAHGGQNASAWLSLFKCRNLEQKIYFLPIGLVVFLVGQWFIKSVSCCQTWFKFDFRKRLFLNFWVKTKFLLLNHHFEKSPKLSIEVFEIQFSNIIQIQKLDLLLFSCCGARTINTQFGLVTRPECLFLHSQLISSVSPKKTEAYTHLSRLSYKKADSDFKTCAMRIWKNIVCERPARPSDLSCWSIIYCLHSLYLIAYHLLLLTIFLWSTST